ncbi:MAG: GNAT family N-acetyltransferase [Nannocystaceae bacterium]|nr:GNAT family N-acetyltransferase [Nannocystaceae bacterium]
MLETSVTAATMPLGALAPRLQAAGLWGVFGRHLLRVRPELAVPVDGDAFVLGGPMHGRYEVGFSWAFGDDADAIARLLQRPAVRERLHVYVPEAIAADVHARVPQLARAADHLLTCTRPPPGGGAEIVALTPDTPRERFDPEIADRLPPPPIWQRFGFAYHGVLDRGVIASVLETTVDDGDHVAIQQVFTASAARGRGLGRALLRTVTAGLCARGRVAVYLCAVDNLASLSLARSAGFALQRSPALLQQR